MPRQITRGRAIPGKICQPCFGRTAANFRDTLCDVSWGEGTGLDSSLNRFDVVLFLVTGALVVGRFERFTLRRSKRAARDGEPRRWPRALFDSSFLFGSRQRQRPVIIVILTIIIITRVHSPSNDMGEWGMWVVVRPRPKIQNVRDTRFLYRPFSCLQFSLAIRLACQTN